jgi:hypothetical protein
VVTSRHGERTNEAGRRRVAGKTSTRRSGKIEKRVEAHTHAIEEAKALKLDIEIAKLAAELKRLIE